MSKFYPRKILIKPILEPITVDLAKKHCRVDISDDDTFFGKTLIPAARKRAEKDLYRGLITQTWQMFLDCFPLSCPTIEIPLPPLQSIESVKYIDTDGDEQTLDTSLYQVDAKSEPARLAPAAGETWPSTKSQTLNAVTIEFKIGYGDVAADVDAVGDVDEDLILGMLQLIGHWYEHREDIVTGTISQEVQQTYNWLIEDFIWEVKV